MGATVEYSTLDFSTLGSTPTWQGPTVSFERERSGALTKATHRITITGAIVAAGSTLAQRQDSLNTRRTALMAILDAGPAQFRVLDDDGTTVALQYGGSDPTGASPNATWRETLDGDGMFVDSYEFDDDSQGGGVLHVNVLSYRITLMAEVDAECDVSGVQACHYTTSVRRQNNALQSISYSGYVVVCEGTECEDALQDLIDDLEVEAAALFATEGVEFVTSTDDRTDTKNDPGRCSFSITFSIGTDTGGTSADSIVPFADWHCIANRFTLTVGADYTTTRANFSTVKEEARRLDGVDVDSYLPQGSVKLVHSETRLSFSPDQTTIRGQQTIIGHWKHSSTIVSLSERIQIDPDLANVTPRLHAWLFSDSVPPACALHVGGAGPLRVSITVEIEATQQFTDLPPRFTQDYLASPILTSGSARGWNTLTLDVEGDITAEGLYRSTVTQVWIFESSASLTPPIPITSILNATDVGIPEAN